MIYCTDNQNLKLTTPLASAQCHYPTGLRVVKILNKPAKSEMVEAKVTNPKGLWRKLHIIHVWCGCFSGYVKRGCLVAFDKSKSLEKRYGKAPTEPLAESELVLI
jgi:hypothetical protein